jgi:hypothetical protein
MNSMKTFAKRPSKDRRCALKGAALALLSIITISPSLISPSIVHAATTDSPFTELPGSWAGTGTIALSSGAKERIRCRATYRLENPVNLRLEMSCTSDSYRFELRSHIIYDNQTISGSWDEQTRHVSGLLTGRASGARIQARAEGQTFTALLDMTTRGNRQSVSIQSPGSEMSGVTILLTRGAH